MYDYAIQSWLTSSHYVQQNIPRIRASENNDIINDNQSEHQTFIQHHVKSESEVDDQQDK